MSQIEKEYIETDPHEQAQYLWSSLFHFLAKETIDRHGEEGERVVRQAVRDYGTARGRRMRQTADAEGRPATLETLFSSNDLPGDGRFARLADAVLTPEVKRSCTTRCPNAEIWAQLGAQRYGEIYCEEVHHAIYMGFDPAVQVNLSETLTNGGQGCRFAVYLRKSNQRPYDLPPRPVHSWDDDGGDPVAKNISCFNILYSHMGRAILSAFGEETLRAGVRAFGRKRGERMKEMHRRMGLPNNLKTLFSHGDLPADPRAKRTLIKLDEHERSSQTHRCQYYEIWRDYDALDAGRIYCEEVHHAMWQAYNSDIEVNLPRTIAHGHPFCEFRVLLSENTHGGGERPAAS